MWGCSLLHDMHRHKRKCDEKLSITHSENVTVAVATTGRVQMVMVAVVMYNKRKWNTFNRTPITHTHSHFVTVDGLSMLLLLFFRYIYFGCVSSFSSFFLLFFLLFHHIWYCRLSFYFLAFLFSSCVFFEESHHVFQTPIWNLCSHDSLHYIFHECQIFLLMCSKFE